MLDTRILKENNLSENITFLLSLVKQISIINMSDEKQSVNNCLP